jgi:hypothetical protein
MASEQTDTGFTGPMSETADSTREKEAALRKIASVDKH